MKIPPIGPLLVVTLLAGPSCRHQSFESTRLYREGVKIEWVVGGAVGAYAHIEVSYTSPQGTVVECPPIFGGIRDADLKFEDLNGDGVEEIIFSGEEGREVASFDPKSKTFAILENTVR